MNNFIGWFEIYVDDMLCVRIFYEMVLNVSLISMVDLVDGFLMYGFLLDMENYGSLGVLVLFLVVKVGNNSIVVYFFCDDCVIEVL